MPGWIERLGLGARVAALGVLAMLAIAAVGGWVLREGVHAAVQRGLEQALSQRVERILAHLERSADGSLVEGRQRGGDEFSQIFSGWYWQLQAPGQTLRSRSLWDSALATPPGAASAGLQRTHGPRGEPLLGLRRSVTVEGVQAELYVFGSARETDEELARLDRVLLAMLVALVLALLLALLAQLRWGLRPLRQLHAAVSAVRDGRSERIGRGYGPDLDPLATGMDEVLDRNARIVARVRNHAADLSHALKKPLSLLAAEAEAAPQVRAAVVRHEVAGLTRLIDRHLARAGSGAGEQRRIDVGERLGALVDLMERLHAERGLHWQRAWPAELQWRGELTDLEEMLGNLLDNAGKWAAKQVVVRAWRDADGMDVQVQDDGPGIPAPQIDEAIRRGRRFDETTEGSGLGLAIVSDIAETYGGRLVLAAGPLGGLQATLQLPG